MMLVLSACATNLSRATRGPEPAQVPLGDFQAVEVKAVSLSEPFAANTANQRALKKIDENVFLELKSVFPDLKRIEEGQSFSTGGKTLQITPTIKEIKFISGGARFWVGAMAGSSAVLMEATFTDSSTGNVIAHPDFYREAGAHSGGWTVGGTDNKMLILISKDLADYAKANK